MITFFKDVVKNSIITKAFLGLLILSFGVWGVGDFVAPSMNPNVIVKVGGAEVRLDEVQRRFTSQLNQFRQALGAQMADDESMRRIMLEGVVNDLARSATIEAAAQDLGIIVTRDRLRELVREQQMFQDETGAFSPQRYAQILASNNITEAGFINLFESDIRRQILLQQIPVNASAPQYLLGTLQAYRGEGRTAETLLVSAADMADPGVPTDADLTAAYEANIATFTAPEYRKLSLVMLQPGDLVKPDSFTDEEVQTYYDENIARYRTRPSRTVVQMVFGSREEAESARAHMAPGDDLAAIAAKAKLPPPVNLGQLTADSPIAAAIAPAFQLPAGEVSAPVQTDLGWHLFQVSNIVEESTTPLDAVKDEIRMTMAEDKGVDAIYDASVALEEDIFAGAPLKDAAERIGARYFEFEAIDRNANDPAGKPVVNEVLTDQVMQTAFATPEDTASRLLEIPGGGYFILRVEAVTPPTPKPLEAVRDNVVTLWQRETRLKAARDLAAAAADSASFEAAAAADKRLSYARLGPVDRFGQSTQPDLMVDIKRVSPDMLDRLFQAKTGESFVADTADGVVAARLVEIAPAAPLAGAAFDQMSGALREAIGDDLTAQFTGALTERYPATINREMLDQLVATSR